MSLESRLQKIEEASASALQVKQRRGPPTVLEMEIALAYDWLASDYARDDYQRYHRNRDDHVDGLPRPEVIDGVRQMWSATHPGAPFPWDASTEPTADPCPSGAER